MSETSRPFFELTETLQRGRILDGKAVSTARPRRLHAIRGQSARLVNQPSLAVNHLTPNRLVFLLMIMYLC